MNITDLRRRDWRRDRRRAIDFDFYRTRATALRGEARRDARTVRLMCVALLALVVVLATVFAIAAAP